MFLKYIMLEQLVAGTGYCHIKGLLMWDCHYHVRPSSNTPKYMRVPPYLRFCLQHVPSSSYFRVASLSV